MWSLGYHRRIPGHDHPTPAWIPCSQEANSTPPPSTYAYVRGSLVLVTHRYFDRIFCVHEGLIVDHEEGRGVDVGLRLDLRYPRQIPQRMEEGYCKSTCTSLSYQHVIGCVSVRDVQRVRATIENAVRRRRKATPSNTKPHPIDRSIFPGHEKRGDCCRHSKSDQNTTHNAVSPKRDVFTDRAIGRKIMQHTSHKNNTLWWYLF